MTSLAARDQENLINSHQTAAASKPLNQIARGLQPKTPGDKLGQTPFRGRIHDENATVATNGGKGGARENLALNPLGKLKPIEIATPAPIAQGPRNALAPKTTNAKTKTPAIGLAGRQDLTIVRRSGNRPPSVRRAKSQIEESTKLQIPADDDTEDGVPDIEYMPPRGVPLPDHDEDLVPPIDLRTELENFDHSNLLRYNMLNKYHTPDESGITKAQRIEKEDQETDRLMELREDADIMRNSELATMWCDCDDGCYGQECHDRRAQREAIEARYQKVVRGLLTPDERRKKEDEKQERTRQTKAEANAKVETNTTRHSRMPSRTGPSESAARRAANVLSMRSDKDRPAVENGRARDYPKPWLAGSKKVAVVPLKDAPEGYISRHAAAAAASRTNMGFSKGRSVSAGIRKAGLPTETSNSRSKQHGQPRKTEAQWLQEMWDDLKRRQEQEEEEEERGTQALSDWRLQDLLLEEAGQDFELELDFSD